MRPTRDLEKAETCDGVLDARALNGGRSRSGVKTQF